MKIWRRLRCDVNYDHRFVWVRKPKSNWSYVYLIENMDFTYTVSTDLSDFIPMIQPEREPKRFYISNNEIYTHYEGLKKCDNIRDVIEKMYAWELKTFIPIKC